MEAGMSYREYVEWIAYFNSEGSSGSASGGSWQKQMQAMRMIGDLQGVRK
jgi:hypothetical protein